jgi:hypothetical protein
MGRRWLIVVITAVALVGVPLLVRARPAGRSDLDAARLAALIQASGAVAWSGSVETVGDLDVPDSDSFANLADLLGQHNELRVWWRSAEEWRIDRLRSTGETDLYHFAGVTISWVFESETATIAPTSTIRLPDASDLLPPTLARSVLNGARPDELSRLPNRRVAGIDAPGLRLTPAGEPTTISHVDVWADATTGLPLSVELSATGADRPVLASTLTSVDQTAPPERTTRFDPPQGIREQFDESVDVAAEANALAAVDLPETLAGLPSRAGADAAAVGVYGRGPTILFALPLRRQVSRPLRQRLRADAGAAQTPVGTVTPVGPIGVLLTPGRRDPNHQGGAILLAGTVTPDVLEQAAAQLLGGS